MHSTHLVTASNTFCPPLMKWMFTFRGSLARAISLLARAETTFVNFNPNSPTMVGACWQLYLAADGKWEPGPDSLTNVTVEVLSYEVVATDLRRSRTYHLLYTVLGNTLVATVIPVVCLIYFNSSIVLSFSR